MIIHARFARVLLLGCTLAGPAAAQTPAAPADLLALEGIVAAPPAGLPPFEQVANDSGPGRMYRSMAGGTTILVSILGPFHTWADSGLDARHRLVKVGMRRRERDSKPDDVMRQDSTYLIGEIRTVVPDGRRLIERTSVPLTGVVTVTRVNVLTGGTPDPATERALMAFLDAARPRTRVNLLAREGIDAEPPAGFHPFELFRSTSGGAARMYRSRAVSGSRMIVVTVFDPFASWGDGDLEGRPGLLRTLMGGARPNAARSASSAREDATHLTWESPTTGVEGTHGIRRGYMPRTGPAAIVSIVVMDDIGTPDPAADPTMLAFLDAARPSRAPVPVAMPFRRLGVEMELPRGIVPPTLGSRAITEAPLFISRSGNRWLTIQIVENTERQAARWPPERRLRHLRRWMDPFLEHTAPRMDETVHESDGLAWNDFHFSRMHEVRGVAGRGRIYSTQSGPHRMIAVMYFETDSDQLADEAAIVRMLDSLRVEGLR